MRYLPIYSCVECKFYICSTEECAFVIPYVDLAEHDTSRVIPKSCRLPQRALDDLIMLTDEINATIGD